MIRADLYNEAGRLSSFEPDSTRQRSLGSQSHRVLTLVNPIWYNTKKCKTLTNKFDSTYFIFSYFIPLDWPCCPPSTWPCTCPQSSTARLEPPHCCWTELVVETARVVGPAEEGCCGRTLLQKRNSKTCLVNTLKRTLKLLIPMFSKCWLWLLLGLVNSLW